ncbi:MAG: restriction endonuclease subunit S, partial [Marinifilaceae bacterium]|nr:restriction endonuclease subunit S [Marinifilaceae bacterium]
LPRIKHSNPVLSMEKQKNIPKLRFPDFSGEWEKIRLGAYIHIASGNSPSLYNLSEFGKYPFIKVEELNNCDKYQISSRFYTDDSQGIVEPLSIIFPKRGAAILNNKVRLNAVPVIMDSNLMAVKPISSRLDSEFLFYVIIKEKLFKIADTSTIPQINNKHIEPYRFFTPPLPEQQKIASFFSAIDQKISQLKRKKSLLEQYKKGVMQKIFSQEIRFKDDNGQEFPKWEKKKGDALFETVSNKNHKSDLPILAITQEYGAIPREMIDYYITVTEQSIESYKVVEKGDFIISLRSFQGGIEYSEYKGICSPAYIILRATRRIDHRFFKYYFKTDKYITDLNRKLEGIRDGKMISYKYFSEIKIDVPILPEQTKIANFLSAIDDKINHTQKQIEKVEVWKKGLMQQMFV